MYPEELVRPMKQQLVDKGFSELITEDDVNQAVEQKGTVLLVLNSVCGCAAGTMRPGVLASLDNDKLPENLTTAFAGVDKSAVDQARKFMLPYPPSSPSIGLFKDGTLIHFIERHHIEGKSAEMIAENLKIAYDEYC